MSIEIAMCGDLSLFEKLSIRLCAYSVLNHAREFAPVLRIVHIEPVGDEVGVSLVLREQNRLDRAFESAGLQRATVCEVNDVPLLIRLVEQGLGISVIPLVAHPLSSNLAYVPVLPALPPWQLAATFVGEEPLNVAARELLRMLRRGTPWTVVQSV